MPPTFKLEAEPVKATADGAPVALGLAVVEDAFAVVKYAFGVTVVLGSAIGFAMIPVAGISYFVCTLVLTGAYVVVGTPATRYEEVA
jgi:hypothetical protein